MSGEYLRAERGRVPGISGASGTLRVMTLKVPAASRQAVRNKSILRMRNSLARLPESLGELGW